MTLKFNILIITPTPSSLGNCARDIKLALIEAGRNGFKAGLIETIEWFVDLNNLRIYKPDIYNI